MSESDATGERVCSTADVSEGSAHVVERAEVDVAVFCIDGEYYALNNQCPHQGGPLGNGRVEDDCVYCPWHGWEFEVDTGEHAQGMATAESYEVEVVDGGIYVDF